VFVICDLFLGGSCGPLGFFNAFFLVNLFFADALSADALSAAALAALPLTTLFTVLC